MGPPPNQTMMSNNMIMRGGAGGVMTPEQRSIPGQPGHYPMQSMGTFSDSKLSFFSKFIFNSVSVRNLRL